MENSFSFQPALVASITLPLLKLSIVASCFATTTGFLIAIIRDEKPSLTLLVTPARYPSVVMLSNILSYGVPLFLGINK